MLDTIRRANEVPAEAILGLQVVSERISDEVAKRTLVYPAREGTLRVASLVGPATTRPTAGILFVHWYEPLAADSNRTQFLAEAERLAERGVLSLAIETMWSDREWFIKRTHAMDYQLSIEQIMELRTALAILRYELDDNQLPIGYVGHDFGAMYE